MGCGNPNSKPKSNASLRVDLPSKDREFKVVLLGNPSVGKTSIVNRYLSQKFSTEYQVTIGSTFQQKLVTLPSGGTVKLDIWDTGGQERFRALLPLYYRDASAALIVFDLTDIETFEQCKFWVSEVQREQPTCRITLVGNKVDRADAIQVEEGAAKAYAHQCQMTYAQTSAKSGMGIDALFETVAVEVTRTGK
jgi:Ras-related protein Rab-5C